MSNIRKASRAVARELSGRLEDWLLELANLIAERSASARPPKKKKAAKKKPGRPEKKKATRSAKGSTKKRGRRPGGNLDKIKKAVGKRGARIKDIAEKTGIAAPNVSNYISNNPGVFVKSRKRGGKVTLK
jgi:hypothetical protein|tara:strand:+ start:485 stop:874 length:390 start_codon:yes stop_codon:yes gene_type:complete